MQTIDRAEKHGDKLLKEAKNDLSYRKKLTNHNLNQALLEGVSFEVRQPVTTIGDPIKAFEYRQNNKISCCICGISAGTFFIENRKSYCREHKKFMHMTEKQKNEELSKC